MSTPSPTRASWRPAAWTALVCRGCCCGSPIKHGNVDHAGHEARVRLAATRSPGSNVRVVRCLGHCSSSNVVAIRSHQQPRDRVWVGSVNDDARCEALATWLEAGGPAAGAPPEPLRWWASRPLAPRSPTTAPPTPGGVGAQVPGS